MNALWGTCGDRTREAKEGRAGRYTISDGPSHGLCRDGHYVGVYLFFGSGPRLVALGGTSNNQRSAATPERATRRQHR
jgi:hypothetical protein